MTAIAEIERKSLLYCSKVEYGGWTVNHVHGCSHYCRFPCYAMMMAKRFGRVRDDEEWVRPHIVANALDLLDDELGKLGGRIDSVHLCFSTDPFTYDTAAGGPLSAVSDMSTEIVSRLNRRRTPSRH